MLRTITSCSLKHNLSALDSPVSVEASVTVWIVLPDLVVTRKWLNVLSF